MRNPNELYALAFTAYRSGELIRANALLDQCLIQAPDMASAYLLKSVTHESQDTPVRLALVEQAVALDPTDPEGWYNLGVFHGERDERDQALAAYRRAVLLDPYFADALKNGCELLRRSGEFDTALEWADRQLQTPSDAWPGHLNRAVCLLHMRRFDEAEAAFAEAKRLAPDRPIIDWERFAEAWDDFEHRFACGHLNGVFCYPFAQPLWRGEALAGRHILIHNEQGLGDQLMFASALHDVVAAAGRVTLIAAPELVSLFTASFPTVRVLPALYGAFAGDHPEPPWLNALGPVDFQAPIGSVMAVLRRTPESFSTTPYLRPSDAARRAWAGFDPGPGLKVGLCWASNPAVFRADSAQRAVRKSMRLEAMAALASVSGASLVSVLNWSLDPAPAAFEGQLLDVSNRLRSLDDTAALIERLDLVITVDTAVAHLAGAMGKETWLLLHDFADCRWGLEGDRSYWYRAMALIRQSSAGDWAGVIETVVERLHDRVGADR